MGRAVLKEVFLLRAAACLSILFLHSMTRVYEVEEGWIAIMKLLLSYGTPAFILISEIVIAYAYPTHTPHGFLQKRLRYVVMPFLVFLVVYAVQDTFTGSGEGSLTALLYALTSGLFLGETPGYFVLVIFQFYILHMICVKYVFSRYRPAVVIAVAAIINFAYLGFFNLVNAPSNPTAIFIWERFYRMPFPGWILYFVVAYYLGSNYTQYIKVLNRYKHYLYALVASTAIAAGYLLSNGLITAVSSKRIDMIFFTISMVFLLLMIGSNLKFIPSTFVKISQYSFGIYLVHPLIYAIGKLVINPIPIFHNNMVGVIIFFFMGLLASMFTVEMLNQFRWGHHVIGRIGVGLDPKLPEEKKNKEFPTNTKTIEIK